MSINTIRTNIKEKIIEETEKSIINPYKSDCKLGEVQSVTTADLLNTLTTEITTAYVRNYCTVPAISNIKLTKIIWNDSIDSFNNQIYCPKLKEMNMPSKVTRISNTILKTSNLTKIDVNYKNAEMIHQEYPNIKTDYESNILYRSLPSSVYVTSMIMNNPFLYFNKKTVMPVLSKVCNNYLDILSINSETPIDLYRISNCTNLRTIICPVHNTSLPVLTSFKNLQLVKIGPNVPIIVDKDNYLPKDCQLTYSN